MCRFPLTRLRWVPNAAAKSLPVLVSGTASRTGPASMLVMISAIGWVADRAPSRRSSALIC